MCVAAATHQNLGDFFEGNFVKIDRYLACECPANLQGFNKEEKMWCVMGG